MSDLFSAPVRKAASISPCGTYRYRLTRYWGPGHFLPFVMLNPSTADADLDDPTIRRCMGFAHREGAGGIVVVNLYALRATDPGRIALHPDPIGPDNFDALDKIATVSEATQHPVVCAWGAMGEDLGRYIADRMRRLGASLRCLGTTKAGHPRHPLYVRADQPLVPFS